MDVSERGDIDRGSDLDPDDEFPRFPRISWQAFASTQMEEAFFNTAISPRLGQTDQAVARSQRGPLASIPFFTAPVSAATHFDPQCFRVLLLRRLWCQLPLSSATCLLASHLTLVAITGELVLTQGSWVAEGFHW